MAFMYLSPTYNSYGFTTKLMNSLLLLTGTCLDSSVTLFPLIPMLLDFWSHYSKYLYTLCGVWFLSPVFLLVRYSPQYIPFHAYNVVQPQHLCQLCRGPPVVVEPFGKIPRLLWRGGHQQRQIETEQRKLCYCIALYLPPLVATSPSFAAKAPTPSCSLGPKRISQVIKTQALSLHCSKVNCLGRPLAMRKKVR